MGHHRKGFQIEGIEPLHSISDSCLDIKRRKMVTIKNEFGQCVSVRLCKSEYEEFEDIGVECIQRNQSSFIFVFSFVSYFHGLKHRAYLFLKKDAKVVDELISKCIHIQNNANTCHHSPDEIDQMILMHATDKVKILMAGPKLTSTTFEQFYNSFMKLDSSDHLKGYCSADPENTKTKLTFEKLLDENEHIDFVLMIYQEARKTHQN